MRWSAISYDAVYSQITHVVASPLLDTPDEIWIIAFAGLDHSTLASLCLVNKRFKAIATPFLYHDPFEILIKHPLDVRMHGLLETLTKDSSLTALIRVYRDVSVYNSDFDPELGTLDEADYRSATFIPRLALEAMIGVTRADIRQDEMRFVRFCPSHSNLLELEMQVKGGWSKEKCDILSIWLSEQQRVRRLVWTGTTPEHLIISSGVFPDLRNLTCDSSMAAEFPPSRPIHIFRCRGEGLTVNTKDRLVPLMQHLSQHLRKVQLLIEVEDLEDIIKFLVTSAPYLTVLKLAILGSVQPCDIQATADIMYFPSLRILSLRFAPQLQVNKTSSSARASPNATLGTPVLDMIGAWRKLCPHLNQVTLGCFTFHVSQWASMGCVRKFRVK
ncbi:hypothetical protein FRB95_008814 [Tulasnella sp. JGI-2019a]|nr:hypothetical protein FRB95_008814 [Tulasnella sp. JGI-2019a]